jgi:hypothetical protein
VVRMLPADTAGLGSTSPEPRPAAVHRWTTACDVAACAACAEGSRPTTEDGE